MENNKRSVAISIIFSLVSPGLGHMYCGQIKAGIIIYISYIIYTFLLLEIGMASTFAGLIIFVLLEILFLSAVIIHVVKLAKAYSDFTLKKYNMPIYYILWIVIVFLASDYIKDIYGYKAYRTPTPAMEPTLLIGDHIYVDRRVTYEEIKPGNVITFKYPLSTDLDYVKRCIATGGMEVNIIDKKVYIDNVRLDDSAHVQFLSSQILSREQAHYTFENGKYGSRDNFGPIKVPKDHLFVMGDNRDNSSDSRMWGFVPKDNLTGKVKYIYFSIDSSQEIFEFSKYIRFSRFGNNLEQNF